jgi:hypothetical protein
MQNWFKAKKNPLIKFVETQKKQGRKIIYSEGFLEKIENEYGEKTSQILETTSSFLTEVLNKKEIKVISLLFDKRSPAAWLNKREPSKFILNFAIDLTNPETQERIKKAITKNQKIELEKIKPNEVPPEQSVLISTKSAETEKVFSGKLLEIGKGVKIFFSNTKDLEIRVIQEENFLELSTKDGKWLFIHLWEKRKPPEVTIGGKDYRLRENTIAELGEEFEWVNGHLTLEEIREFPLSKGEKGEKIIDLKKIENEEVTNFLSGR